MTISHGINLTCSSETANGELTEAAAAIIALDGVPVFGAFSTDANVAMSIGVAAVTMFWGGEGGGAHSLSECIDVKPTETVEGMSVGMAVLLTCSGVKSNQGMNENVASARRDNFLSADHIPACAYAKALMSSKGVFRSRTTYRRQTGVVQTARWTRVSNAIAGGQRTSYQFDAQIVIVRQPLFVDPI